MRFLRVLLWLPFAAACTDSSADSVLFGSSSSALIDSDWVALEPPDPQLYDQFGFAVAVDGEQALVGIPTRDQADDLGDDSGAARLFHYTEGRWQDGEELVAAERAPSSNLGWSVALRGTSAAIGNPFASVMDGPEAPYKTAGLVYAFYKAPSGWRSQQLQDPELAVERCFGAALAAFDNEIVVGAPSFGRPGSAYVYGWSASEGWRFKQELIRPAETAHPDDNFGAAIASDAVTMLVSAPGVLEATGEVYVYERDNLGLWQHVGTLRGASKPPVPGDRFGYAVAVHGNQALIGAPGGSVAVAPVAYLFEQAFGTWPQTATKQFRLEAPETSGQFASAVGVGKNWVWIGAPNQGAGVVYPVELQGGEWQDRVPLSPSAQSYTRFGSTIATVGRTALIGSPGDDSSGGDVFFFAQGNGAECEQDFECTSGHCVDGICCDTLCDAACYSCRAADTKSRAEGECGPIADSVAPPAGECPAEDPSSCGRTGMCDGMGECALYGSETLCAQASCDGSSRRPASHCDGLGSCPPRTSVSCGKLSCKSGVCAKCANDADCLDDEFCSLSGCEEKRELLAECSDGRECMSGACPAGHCIDGPECSDDGTEVIATDGKRTPCREYVCWNASCPTSCETSMACQQGFACDANNECVTIPKARGNTRSSCSYTPPQSSESAWAALAGLMTMAFFAMCPRKRRRRVAPAKDGTDGVEE